MSVLRVNVKVHDAANTCIRINSVSKRKEKRTIIDTPELPLVSVAVAETRYVPAVNSPGSRDTLSDSKPTLSVKAGSGQLTLP